MIFFWTLNFEAPDPTGLLDMRSIHLRREIKLTDWGIDGPNEIRDFSDQPGYPIRKDQNRYTRLPPGSNSLRRDLHISPPTPRSCTGIHYG